MDKLDYEFYRKYIEQRGVARTAEQYGIVFRKCFGHKCKNTPQDGNLCKFVHALPEDATPEQVKQHQHNTTRNMIRIIMQIACYHDMINVCRNPKCPFNHQKDTPEDRARKAEMRSAIRQMRGMTQAKYPKSSSPRRTKVHPKTPSPKTKPQSQALTQAQAQQTQQPKTPSPKALTQAQAQAQQPQQPQALTHAIQSAFDPIESLKSDRKVNDDEYDESPMICIAKLLTALVARKQPQVINHAEFLK